MTWAGVGPVRTARASGSPPAGVAGARCGCRCGVVLAAWLAGPAVVMVTAFPAVLTVSRNMSWGHGAQIPLAATVLPSEVACAIELRISSLPRTSASPYQDCRAPRSRRPGVATAAGNPPAARPSTAWIWPRQAAQYRSYFDVTAPVCPGKPGTTARARGDGRPVQHDVALCYKRPRA
jgi:hypothetical protein